MTDLERWVLEVAYWHGVSRQSWAESIGKDAGGPRYENLKYGWYCSNGCVGVYVGFHNDCKWWDISIIPLEHRRLIIMQSGLSLSKITDIVELTNQKILDMLPGIGKGSDYRVCELCSTKYGRHVFRVLISDFGRWICSVCDNVQIKSDGTVYFVRSSFIGSTPVVKIGFTRNDVPARLLQQGLKPSSLLCTVEGTIDLESSFHQMFDEYCVGGEFFRLEGALERYVSSRQGQLSLWDCDGSNSVAIVFS